MKNQKGFTLIELLLVLAIIGIISAIAVPALLGQRARARMQATKDNTTACLADLTSTLGELSDPPSERNANLPVAIYSGDQASNKAKAQAAVDYTVSSTSTHGKTNFTSAKNPYGSGQAYVMGAVSTVDGTVYVDITSADTTVDPVITVSGVYRDAKGNQSVLAKTVSVN